MKFEDLRETETVVYENNNIIYKQKKRRNREKLGSKHGFFGLLAIDLAVCLVISLACLAFNFIKVNANTQVSESGSTIEDYVSSTMNA